MSLRERVAERLVADIERHDWHLTTGFVGVGLLCPVLTEAGYADVAYRLLLNETFPSWGYSIRHGATTIWERWDGWTEEHGFQTPLMNSFNHYSLGSVAQWLYEYVAGIRLAKPPGYEHVLIAPEPGPLAVGARDIPLRARPDHERVAAGRATSSSSTSRSRRTSPPRWSCPDGERCEASASGRRSAFSAARRHQSASSFARARARSSDRVRTPSLVYTWLR